MKKLRKTRLLSLILALCAVGVLVTNAIFATDTLKDPSTIDKTRIGSITLLKYEQAAEVDADFLTGTGLSDQDIPEGATPLPGVTFKLEKVTNDTISPADAIVDATSNISITTNSEGKAVFSDLQQGLYLVTETDAPANVSEKTPPFLVNIPMSVTVDLADGTKQDQWLYDVTVYPKNQTIYGSVVLTKTAGDEPTKLAGAEFQLYKYDNETGTTTDLYSNTTYATDDNGQIAIEGLPKGFYAFVETKAPSGYGINSTPQIFEITTSGEVVLDGSAYVTATGTPVFITMKNDLTPEIHKGVKSPTNQHAGYDIDASHTWVISTTIPSDITT